MHVCRGLIILSTTTVLVEHLPGMQNVSFNSRKTAHFSLKMTILDCAMLHMSFGMNISCMYYVPVQVSCKKSREKIL